MTPDISEIIKVCLRITKYIMFYIPRTLMLEELFEIISAINGKNRLFFDSAPRIQLNTPLEY